MVVDHPPAPARFGGALAAEATVEWLMVPRGGRRELITLDDVLRRPEWHRWAACAGVDARVFFPVRGESTAPAKAICAGCEVRSECLEEALADVDRAGIWGGSSSRERREMRRRVA